MAHVKICDRCGKKIETTGIWPIYVKHFRSILEIEDRDYEDGYDLCGDCTKKLFEFLEGNGEDSATDSVTSSITEATDV